MAKKNTGQRSRRTPAAKRRGRWVRHVAETSNAMDLPKRIFKGSPAAIARGLERSVLRSRRTKGTKFQSAKVELRKVFERPARAA